MSFPIYSEKYEVYLIEAEEKIYRVQIYWQVKEVFKLDTPKKRVKHTIKLQDVYVEEVFKYGGEKK